MNENEIYRNIQKKLNHDFDRDVMNKTDEELFGYIKRDGKYRLLKENNHRRLEVIGYAHRVDDLFFNADDITYDDFEWLKTHPQRSFKGYVITKIEEDGCLE